MNQRYIIQSLKKNGFLSLIFCVVLAGCENSEMNERESPSVIAQVQGIDPNNNESQPVFTPEISHVQSEPVSNDLPAHAQPFIGRFFIIAECSEEFVPCEEGVAKVTVTFLPNGKIRRSIIQYGKIFKENLSYELNQENYAEDRWFVNEQATEMQVIRQDGLKIYYKIKSKDQLVMDLEKMKIENQALYDMGFPQPKIAYTLNRKTNLQTAKNTTQ